MKSLWDDIKFMILPTSNKELQLLRVGHKYIAGVDEAGRGPLAGPVVAAAIIFNTQNQTADIEKDKADLVRDSKLLSAAQRVKAYKWVIENCLVWSVGIVSEEEIDKIGIRNASLAAMADAINLLSKTPDAVLIDGRDIIEQIKIYQEPIIGGDRNVFSIAAASIIAKTTRDEIMKKYDKIFPQYGFAKHKGYGTQEHYKRLEMFGECRIHRRSFRLY